MVKELILVHLVGGLISGLSVLKRECMEDDEHFKARAVSMGERLCGGKDGCVIFAVDSDVAKSRSIWSMSQKVKA